MPQMPVCLSAAASFPDLHQGRLIAILATKAVFEQNRQSHPQTVAAQKGHGPPVLHAGPWRQHRGHAQRAVGPRRDHPLHDDADQTDHHESPSQHDALATADQQRIHQQADRGRGEQIVPE
jgi:hypothetical protein